MLVSLNGQLIEEEDAGISVSDRGFTLGDGLFETIKIESGSPARFEAHMARLADGCQVLEMPLPMTVDDIYDQIQRAADVNDITDGTARLTLTRGPGPRGVMPPKTPQPTLLIAVGPKPPPPPPARVCVATVTRRNEFSPLSRIKNLNYLDNILARQEAVRRGADDALLLNTEGRVAESTIANLFIQIDGKWLTPPVSEGALPGVARAEFIRENNADTQPITLQMLRRSDRAILTNALGEREIEEILA